MHNNISSSEKVYLLLSLKTLKTCKQCLICADFSPDSGEITFPLEKAILWIEDFLQTQILASQDVHRWTGVVWITCDVFINSLDYHSDGNHSL